MSRPKARNGATPKGVEDALASELARLNWQTLSNFYVFSPVETGYTMPYAECDVVTFSKQGIHLYEVKSPSFDVIAHDEGRMKEWYCTGTKQTFKSPFWQICRARSILIDALRTHFLPSQSIETIRSFTKATIVYDKVRILNRDDDLQQIIWQNNDVEVLHYDELKLQRQSAENHMPTEIFEDLTRYAELFACTPRLKAMKPEKRTTELLKINARNYGPQLRQMGITFTPPGK